MSAVGVAGRALEDKVWPLPGWPGSRRPADTASCLCLWWASKQMLPPTAPVPLHICPPHQLCHRDADYSLLLPTARGWRAEGERREVGRQAGESCQRPSIFSKWGSEDGIPSPHTQKSILPASACKLVASLRGLEKHFAWRSQDVNPGNPTHTSKHFICQNAFCKGIF